MKYYAAFDTNVLVSSSLTRRTDTATAMVVDAISSGTIVPLYNQDILDEYDEVLHRAGREKEFIHSLSDRELQKNYLLSLRLIKADRAFLYG